MFAGYALCILIVVVLFLRYIDYPIIQYKRYTLDTLPENIMPSRYEMKLMLIDDENYYGESKISFHIVAKTNEISFHSIRQGIYYQATKLVSYKQSVSHIQFKYDYDILKQLHTIHFFKELQPGYYTIYIKFIGSISDVSRDGFYRIPHAKDTQGNDRG